MIRPLTNWVLAEALQQCRRWRDEGLTLGVSVTVSASFLQGQRLPEKVEELLREVELDGSALRLEATESAIMRDPAHATELFARLRALGVRLAVDDFGTGHSSLAHLKQLQADEIEIDQSFVQAMVRDPRDEVIVRTAIDLAHGLGSRVVAEWAENHETLFLLAEQNCDAVQGFIHSQPLAPDEAARWVRASRAGAPELRLASTPSPQA